MKVKVIEGKLGNYLMIVSTIEEAEDPKLSDNPKFNQKNYSLISKENVKGSIVSFYKQR